MRANPTENVAERRRIVGDGERERESLGQSLAGRTIVVTRAREQADDLVRVLEARGAFVLLAPAIAFAPPVDPGPLERAARAIASYDWLVVTSRNAVRPLFALLGGGSLPVALRVAAVGAATAGALRAEGARVDVVPDRADAEALARTLASSEPLAGRRVLFPCGDRARDAVVAGLERAGAIVDRVVAYATVAGTFDAASLRTRVEAGSIDAIVIASGETARYFLAGLEAAGLARDALGPPRGGGGAAPARPAICAIGGTTASALRALGLRADLVADEPSPEAIARALETAWGRA